MYYLQSTAPARATAQPKPRQGSSSTSSPEPSHQIDFSEVKDTVSLGVLGALPIVGGVSNLKEAYEGFDFFTGTENKNTIGVPGGLANLAGTVTLSVGLLTGNSGATQAGLGMLALSGITRGYIAARD